MTARVIAVLVLWLGSGACTTTPVPAIPSKGGPAWIEVRSEHFTVWTDTSLEQAEKLARAIEHVRQVVFALSYFDPSSNSRSFVIALRDIDEVHAYTPPQFIAEAFDGGTPLLQPVIVLPMDSLDGGVLTHEMTHVVSYNAITRQPHWFSEGLASYFESMRIDLAHSQVDVGTAPINRVRTLRHEGLTSVEAIFACEVPACMDQRFYATSWALFAYLVNVRAKDLLRYMALLAESSPAVRARAWSEAFPDLVPEKLNHDLATWLAYGRTTIRQYPITFQDWPTEHRSLVDADVYAARGLLRYLVNRTAPLLPAEIETAIALDPTNVLAHLVQAAHDKVIKPDVARAVATAHPDDWRAWWLIVVAKLDVAEGRQKVCELVVKNPALLPRTLCPPAPTP